MHNLHYVVIMAKTGKAACEDVEGRVEDYGDENNWRRICGAVSQDDVIYVHDKEGRFVPEPNATIQRINTEILYHIVQSKRALRTNFGKAAIKGLGHLDWSECYRLEKGFNSWGSIVTLNSILKKEGRAFSVLTDSFKECQYDEYGVTNLADWEAKNKPVKGEKKWVVFVDMHS